MAFEDNFRMMDEKSAEVLPYTVGGRSGCRNVLGRITLVSVTAPAFPVIADWLEIDIELVQQLTDEQGFPRFFSLGCQYPPW